MNFSEFNINKAIVILFAALSISVIGLMSVLFNVNSVVSNLVQRGMLWLGVPFDQSQGMSYGTCLQSFDKKDVFKDNDWTRPVVEKYFMCQAAQNESFVNSIENITQDQKNISLVEAVHNIHYNDFLVQMVFGKMEAICPGKLREMCSKSTVIPQVGNPEDNCDSLCTTLNNYATNDGLLTKEIINEAGWKNDKAYAADRFVIIQRRIATIYRFKGSDAASAACKNNAAEYKNNCLDFVRRLDETADRLAWDCASLRKEAVKAVCQVDSAAANLLIRSKDDYQQCLIDVRKMSDVKLIKNYAFKQTSALGDYLVCNVISRAVKAGPNQENYYNEIKNEMQALQSAAGNGGKESLLLRMSSAHNDYSTIIALGGFTKLCPDQLRDICIKDHDYLGVKDKSDCDRICGWLADWKNNQEKLDREIFSGQNWGTPEGSIFREYEVGFRAAVAYWLKGRESAIAVCNGMQSCLDFVSSADKLNVVDCLILRDVFSALACESAVNVYK